MENFLTKLFILIVFLFIFYSGVEKMSVHYNLNKTDYGNLWHFVGLISGTIIAKIFL